MYNNPGKAKSPSQPSIFEIASQIEDEAQYNSEAKAIINAYRKVENMPVVGSKGQAKKAEQPKTVPRKAESEYANKVKETLRELNANRKKEMETHKHLVKPAAEDGLSKLGPAERHLIQSGLKHLVKLLHKKYQQSLSTGFGLIAIRGNAVDQQRQQKIRVWKLRRVLAAWQYEVMLSKIERERREKELAELERKHLRLAGDFSYFCTVKKVFRRWSQETKRALKKREIELQAKLAREEELAKMQQQRSREVAGAGENRKREVIANVELQNKMRGFLDDLKLEVENKDRLKTVRENPKQETEFKREPDGQAAVPLEQEQQGGAELPDQQAAGGQDKTENGDTNEGEAEHRGPLTNQDLENRRKELERKAKQRKEALDKLKREKEEKRKQKEEEEHRIEKEVEIEQKKARQEQYRRFMKQKREEEEWLTKEKQLMRQATQFDALRLVKYYGWLPWVGLKRCNQEKAESLAQVLYRIVMRRKLQLFVGEVMRIGSERLNHAESKMAEYYQRRLARKCIGRLKQNRVDEEAFKQELLIRRQVYTLKVYFKEWLRARSSLQLQNYQWERPRMKRAECLHALTLMRKGMEGLRSNKEEEVESRKIQEHKAKIKEKIHAIVEEKPTINYDDFL